MMEAMSSCLIHDVWIGSGERRKRRGRGGAIPLKLFPNY